MNRRGFLKFLGLAPVALLAAPKLGLSAIERLPVVRNHYGRVRATSELDNSLATIISEFRSLQDYSGVFKSVASSNTLNYPRITQL